MTAPPELPGRRPPTFEPPTLDGPRYRSRARSEWVCRVIATWRGELLFETVPPHPIPSFGRAWMHPGDVERFWIRVGDHPSEVDALLGSLAELPPLAARELAHEDP